MQENTTTQIPTVTNDTPVAQRQSGPLFEVTVRALFDSTITLRFHAPTPGAAEEIAHDIAEGWFRVKDIEEDEICACCGEPLGPEEHRPPFDAEFGSNCVDTETVRMRVSKGSRLVELEPMEPADHV
jgi:hypothetical protein